MNLMISVITDKHPVKDQRFVKKVEDLRKEFKASKFKVEEEFTTLGTTHYYYNGLPYVSEARDVLKKPEGICQIRVNWKKKSFEGMTNNQILNALKPQWGWNLTIVDAEHSRNKFKNKEVCWVVFDTEEKAQKSMDLFNKMFMTAIEQDAINEYKKFKESPDKRPLTFDRLINNYAELYEAVDKGEL